MQTDRNGAGAARGARTPRRLLWALSGMALIGALLSMGPTGAQGTTFAYDAPHITIKAAALTLQQAAGFPPPAMVEGLRRSSLKPAGWDFVNPRGGEGLGAYTPEMTPFYWQVELQEGSHTDLSGYDFLYLATPDLTVLSAFQVDSLLEAVNEGSVLWIENHDPANVTTTGPPGTGTPWQDAPFYVEFTSSDDTPAYNASPTHALLRFPFLLGEQHLQHLGIPATWDEIDQAFMSVNIASLQPLLRESDLNGRKLALVGRYGSGGLLITTGSIGREVWTGSATGAEAAIGQSVDLMFAYNVVAWGKRWLHSRQAANGAGASLGDVRGDLDVAWQSTAGNLGTYAIAGSPVLDEFGRVFVLSYAPAARLYCYDAEPARDLDGNGLADDGTADYEGPGTPDLIWSVALPGGYTPRSTSPAVAVTGLPFPPWRRDSVLVSYVGTNGLAAYVRAYDPATGVMQWERSIGRYRAIARLASLSTPVVHNAYVYVAACEYQLLPGGGADATYSRVHCFDLLTGNTYGWQYPDPTPPLPPAAANAVMQYQMALPPVDDPQWVVNVGRPTLPPVPTPTPVVCNSARYREAEPGNPATLDPLLDAVVYISTPVTKIWDRSAAPPTAVNVPWGSDFALIPTPLNALGAAPSPDPFMRNRRHYRIMLDVAGPTAITQLQYALETAAGTETANYGLAAPTLTGSYAQYTPNAARQFLASIPASSASTAYYDVQAGCRVLVSYTAGGPRQEFDRLPGPVLFQRQHTADADLSLPVAQRAVSGERRVAGGSVADGLLVAPLTVSFNGTLSALPVGYDRPARAGSIVGLNAATGQILWRYDPQASPGSPALPKGPDRIFVDAAPADTETAIIGAASRELATAAPDRGNLGQVFALNPRPDLTVPIRVPIPANHSDPSSAQLVSHTPPRVWFADGSVPADWDANPANLPEIDPACYEVDYGSRQIRFPTETASSVRSTTGVPLGPVYGRMLVVTYAYDSNDPTTPDDPTDDAAMAGEVYGVPGLARWEYIPGLTRLRHGPVAWNGGPAPVQMTLANGIPVTGFVEGEELVRVGGIDWLPTGLIDMDAATYGLQNAPVQCGAEILVTYAGMDADGARPVPNPYETAERHQVPYYFGRPLAGATAARDGQTLVVGTESFSPDGDNARVPDAGPDGGGYAPSGLVPDATRTLLVLAWDKVNDFVRGRLLSPGVLPPGATGAPVVSAAPAVEGDTVIVGTRRLTALPDRFGANPGYQGTLPAAAPYGHVTGLAPVRTVVTDNERILEVAGSEVEWVCTGTRSLDNAYANADAAGDPAWPQAIDPTYSWPMGVPAVQQPFSRAAKAVRLTQTDFLANYVSPAGTVELYRLLAVPPTGGGAVPGIPVGTLWPPKEAGIGPGNYLVVDTGNNRVVEVDRNGRQVWPLANYAIPPEPRWGSRRPDDRLGFDFYSSTLNTILDLKAPSDAHRYWTWNDAGAMPGWEMHTVIADSGHYRVVDVVTTFAYDPTTGQVLQGHRVDALSPPLWRTASGPRRGEYIRVAYTRAQPLFSPRTGQLIGFLCAASNLHELLVLEAGTRRINPPAADQLPGGNANELWRIWSWLYDYDEDGDPSDRLVFENLRHAEVTADRDPYTGNRHLFLTVVCGRYRGPANDPLTDPGDPFDTEGSACVEFRVGDPDLTVNIPARWRLRESSRGWGVPFWYYTEADYQSGPMGHVYLPDGAGGVGPMAQKTFAPSCAQHLLGGRHLIANYGTSVENLVHANVPTSTDALFGTPPSLSADVFEVQTRYNPAAVDDPFQQTHILDVHKAIPNPWLEDWADPLNQPSFAQRCQESLPPRQP